MAWTADTMVDGYDVLLYAQAAGTTAAPTSADEVPFASAFSWASEKDIQARGPWINLSTQKKTNAGTNNTGSVSIDYSKAVQTVRALIIAAGNGTSRIKWTLFIGGANGDKRVWDQCLLNETGEVDPASGVSQTFDWEADSYAFTAGTYA
jgi:hypothetical protein